MLICILGVVQQVLLASISSVSLHIFADIAPKNNLKGVKHYCLYNVQGKFLTSPYLLILFPNDHMHDRCLINFRWLINEQVQR